MDSNLSSMYSRILSYDDDSDMKTLFRRTEQAFLRGNLIELQLQILTGVKDSTKDGPKQLAEMPIHGVLSACMFGIFLNKGFIATGSN